jgi:hypothetical protein
MKIELDLPSRTVRMLKALKELNGLSAGEMGSLAAKILDKGLRQQIIFEVEGEPRSAATPSFIQALESDLAMGLGDEESIEDIKPSASRGVTEDMLNHDLDVDDPSSEAKSEAPASEHFSFFEENSENPWAAKRKKSVKSKGRVSAFTGDESDN